MKVLLTESLKHHLQSSESFLNRSVFQAVYVECFGDLLEALRLPDLRFAVIDAGLAGLENAENRKDLAARLNAQGVDYVIVRSKGAPLFQDEPLKSSAAGYLAHPFATRDLLALMQKHMGIIDRQHIRVRAAMDVKCEYPFHLFSGEMKNLSTGGAMLETDVNLHLGAVIGLEFSLPDVDYFISVQGRIIWSFVDPSTGARRYGIEFTKLKKDDRKMLALFVKGQSIDRAC